MLRRWDLLALAALLLLPISAVGAYVGASGDVSDVERQLGDWLEDLQRVTPPGDGLNLDPLIHLAEHPLTDAARHDVDAVLAGTTAPWDVTASTRDELAAHERIIAPLGASLAATSVFPRPLAPQEWRGATDVGREIAFLAIAARSRGGSAVADDRCALGYLLAIRLGSGGGLDDFASAADVFRTVNDACRESIGTGGRAARLAAIDDILALVSTTPHMADVLTRDRALRMLHMYQRSVGAVPAAMIAQLPARWVLDDDVERSPLMDRFRGRLGMREVARAYDDAIASELAEPRGPVPRTLSSSREISEWFQRSVTDARAAEDLQRATWRVVVARLVAEIFVIDHRRWPTSAGELRVDDDLVNERVQTVLRSESFDFLEHGEHLSITLDGRYSIRATLPDELADLAQQPLPARDFTGHLLEPPPSTQP